jgi:hypothetical protein
VPTTTLGKPGYNSKVPTTTLGKPGYRVHATRSPACHTPATSGTPGR